MVKRNDSAIPHLFTLFRHKLYIYTLIHGNEVTIHSESSENFKFSK